MEAALLEQQLPGTGTGTEGFRAKPSEPTLSTPYYKELLFFFSFFPRGWLKYETIPNRYVATGGNLNRDPNLKWHYSSPCLHSLEMATASPLHVLPAPRQCLSSLLSHHQLLPPALLAFNVFFDLVSLSLLSSCQPPARSPARRIQSLQTIATAVTTKKTTVSSFPKG